jgi:tRNA G18 (ribose-2'-O)-methylase SpoU
MPAYVPVNDPDDPRVASYRDIRERDLVGRGGRFVAEGEVVLAVLLTRSRHAAESCLVSEKRLPAIAPMLAGLADDTPVYVASQAVIDAVTGFHIHRGVLALGRRADAPEPAALLRSLPASALVVVLVGLTNHDNVGGVFRNAAAFGADAVLLDSGTCDPLYRKAIRVSVGGTLMVPFARAESASDILDLLARKGFEAVALSPAGAEPLAAAERRARTALILGTEGRGLPPEILARVRSVCIPMAGDFDSLNVATASGIALHHFANGPASR